MIKNKKGIAALLAAALMIAFTGCGSSNTATEEAPVKSQDAPKAPYIEYVPMTEETLSMVDTIAAAGNNGIPDTQILQYDAGKNNTAIVRLEESATDGSWKVIEEKKLSLQNNLKKGYMAFSGTAWDGIKVNTDMLELGDSLVPNIVKFDNVKDSDIYGTNAFFGDNDISDMSDEELLAKTDTMDMSSKKALLVSFENNVPLSKDGKPCNDPDDEHAVEADVSLVYDNQDGTWTDVYKEQKMLALTIEFVNDENLDKTPYLTGDKDGNIQYNAGAYRMAEFNVAKSTPDGKWKASEDDCEYLSIPASISTGDIKVKESNEGSTVTVKVPEYVMENGEAGMFDADLPVAKHDGFYMAEYSSEDFVKATDPAPLYLAFDENGKKAIDGVSVIDFYKNKDGKYSNIYKDNTFYVLTMKFIE